MSLRPEGTARRTSRYPVWDVPAWDRRPTRRFRLDHSAIERLGKRCHSKQVAETDPTWIVPVFRVKPLTYVARRGSPEQRGQAKP